MDLPVYVRIAPATGKLLAAAEPYDLDCSPLLLVCATTKPAERIHDAAARLGVPRPKSNLELKEAHLPAIVDFAREHPNHLLARPGTGDLHTVTVDGETFTPWADLGAI